MALTTLHYYVEFYLCCSWPDPLNIWFTMKENVSAISCGKNSLPGLDDIQYAMLKKTLNVIEKGVHIAITLQYNLFGAYIPIIQQATYTTQNWFLSRTWTVNQLVILKSSIFDAFIEWRRLVGVFFDPKKAYDTAWWWRTIGTLSSWMWAVTFFLSLIISWMTGVFKFGLNNETHICKKNPYSYPFEG